MAINAEGILSVLDRCCDAYTFPMLDNAYVYLAATRLSLYRSTTDWAMVIEVFGFSPRGELPDTSIQTFASRLHARTPMEKYSNEGAFERHMATNPNNEFRSVSPVEEGPWQDAEDRGLLS